MIMNMFSEEGYDHEYILWGRIWSWIYLVRKGMSMNMFSEEGYDHEYV